MSADTGAKQQRNLMDDFERIYFDTNVLITGGWPAPNALLLPVLELARDLGVCLLVPEPTRVETEMVWLRELYNMRKDQASKSKTQGVVAPELLSTPWDRVRDSYRDSERRLMEAWGFNHEMPVPFATSTLGYGIQATVRRLYMGGSEFLGRPPRVLTFGDDFMFRFRALIGTVLVAATAVFHPPHTYDDLKFESATLSSWKRP